MGLRERLRLHTTWRDIHGELNNAPNEATDAIDRLMKYVKHDSSCDLRMFPNHARECDCGLAELLEEIGDE